MTNTYFYLYNCGGDNAIAVNWNDFWIIIDPMNAKFNGATIDDPDFCEKYAEILRESANSFYEIVLDNNINPNCFCCYDPDKEYVDESDLVQLIAEIPDETKEDDVKSLKWFDANCQEIDFSE